MEKRFMVFLLWMSFLSMFCSVAEGAYVSDSFGVTLRRGPSTGHKIVAMLRSGQRVQLEREENGWALVRVLEGPGQGKEGWILKRFLMDRLPWARQAEQLRAENEDLKARLSGTESDWKRLKDRESELTRQLEEATNQLDSLKKAYQDLREGSADYLNLKRRHAETVKALKEAQDRVKKLSDENEALRYSQNIKWFITGAAVLLCGWLIGLIMGRQRRRRRPGYY